MSSHDTNIPLVFQALREGLADMYPGYVSDIKENWNSYIITVQLDCSGTSGITHYFFTIKTNKRMGFDPIRIYIHTMHFVRHIDRNDHDLLNKTIRIIEALRRNRCKYKIRYIIQKLKSFLGFKV